MTLSPFESMISRKQIDAARARLNALETECTRFAFRVDNATQLQHITRHKPATNPR
jgi:hypothetical protein